MSSNTSGYKALVCVFLTGGNQSWNMIIPTSNTKYSEYANVRTSLAIAQNSILTINNWSSGGNTYGLHPNLAQIQGLANAGQVAVVTNVGTLVKPTTNTVYKSGAASLPYQLFSHLDQQNQWKTSVAGYDLTFGWAGKAADILIREGNSSNLSFGISLSGTQYWNQGNTSDCYVMSFGGASPILPINTFYDNGTYSTAFNAMVADAANNQNLFVQTFRDIVISSNSKQAIVANALSANDFSSNISFTNADNLTGMLHAVARMIKGQANIGDTRQLFFVEQLGYDTHDLELTTQATLYTALANNIFEFQKAMVEIGMQNNVILFTNSDFGRSLVPNSDGSDHGWGGNALVIGNTVNGGIFGTMPSLIKGGVDDADTTGRIIPTLSTDHYGMSLLRWFGIRGYESSNIFPNIINFHSRRVGFPNDILTPATPTYSYFVSNTITANAFTNTGEFTQPNGGKAVIQVNNWNTTSPGFINQTTWANSEKDFGVYANHINDGNVKSYSAYTRGWKLGPGWTTPGDPYLSNTGIQLSALTKWKCRFAFEGPAGANAAGGVGTAANNRVNTLWDLYFHANSTPGTSTAPSVNLMIQPYTIDGDGSYLTYAANATVVNIGNSQYGFVVANNQSYNGNAAQTFTVIQVYPMPLPNANYYGYMDTTCNVKAIVDYFTANGVMNTSHYLTSIQMGWEILAGNTSSNSGTYMVNEAWSALQAEADGPVGGNVANSFVAL